MFGAVAYIRLVAAVAPTAVDLRMAAVVASLQVLSSVSGGGPACGSISICV